MRKKNCTSKTHDEKKIDVASDQLAFQRLSPTANVASDQLAFRILSPTAMAAAVPSEAGNGRAPPL